MKIRVDITPIWHGDTLDAVMLGKTDILAELPAATLAEIEAYEARERADAETEAAVDRADALRDMMREALP